MYFVKRYFDVHTENCFLPLATGEHEQDDQEGDDDASCYRWARFITGHVLSAVAAIYEITQLSVCFDEKLDDDDGTPEENESIVLDNMMGSLTLCLFVDIASAVFLSTIYGQPFDIKHVHKIPDNDPATYGCGTCIVHSLAPFTWGFELSAAGFTSILHSKYSSCEGQGGEGLEYYFLFTGAVAGTYGLFMIGVSALTLFLCFTDDHCTNWCTRARERNRKNFLTKGPYIEYWCMLQGVIWSYRTGSLGLVELIFVAVAGFSGVTLADSAIVADAQEVCTLNCFC